MANKAKACHLNFAPSKLLNYWTN